MLTSLHVLCRVQASGSTHLPFAKRGDVDRCFYLLCVCFSTSVHTQGGCLSSYQRSRGWPSASEQSLPTDTRRRDTQSGLPVGAPLTGSTAVALSQRTTRRLVTSTFWGEVTHGKNTRVHISRCTHIHEQHDTYAHNSQHNQRYWLAYGLKTNCCLITIALPLLAPQPPSLAGCRPAMGGRPPIRPWACVLCGEQGHG